MAVDHGETMGARPPNGRERARSCGAVGEYILSLGLDEGELIDATGNTFDPDSLLDRIAGPISASIGGHALPPPCFPSPMEIRRIYEELSARVRDASLYPEPFPLDGLAATRRLESFTPVHLFHPEHSPVHGARVSLDADMGQTSTSNRAPHRTTSLEVMARKDQSALPPLRSDGSGKEQHSGSPLGAILRTAPPSLPIVCEEGHHRGWVATIAWRTTSLKSFQEMEKSVGRGFYGSLDNQGYPGHGTSRTPVHP